MKKLIFLIFPVLTLFSCNDEEIDYSSEENFAENVVENSTSPDIKVEDATMTDAPVMDVYYAGQKFPVEVHGDKFIYQSDILLDEDLITTEPVKLIYEKWETPPSTKSVGRTAGRWLNGIVYYAIDQSLPNQHRVTEAIQHWEENTGIRFQIRSDEPNYVYFEKGEGCSSYVGMIEGKQEVTLGTGCDTGSVIHEIGHAIGLWHEHSRVDRGDYLKVNFENIEEDKEHNFQTYVEQGIDGAEYTNTLDFQSIMMYPPYAFSKNDLPTLVKLDGRTFDVQRSGLSSGDRAGIAKMYAFNSDGSLAAQEYLNGYYYTIDRVLVYRMHDRWYTYTESGWREITQNNDYWFFV